MTVDLDITNLDTRDLPHSNPTDPHNMTIDWDVSHKNRVSDLLNDGLAFEEHYVNLQDVEIVRTTDFKSERGAGSKANLRAIKVCFDGKEFYPSDRFWLSFCAKVGVAPSIFNLFEHDEVFERVTRENKFSTSGNVRIVEDVKNRTCLAMTDPSKAVADWKGVLDLIDAKGGQDLIYQDGIITSLHTLDAELPVKVGAEDFNQRISVMTPIDGYGLPAVYLALLRQVCSNGMVAMSKAFKTSVKVGRRRGKKGNGGADDTVEFALERMFDSFSNDEGFDALIKRLNAARRSPMSVREFYQVSEKLAKLGHKVDKGADGVSSIRTCPEMRGWYDLAGDLHSRYGLAHLKEMTDKQMSLLETDLTVYEAINYITEVTTHRLNSKISKDNTVRTALQGWVGSKLSKSFDLEGLIDEDDALEEFQPLFFGGDGFVRRDPAFN